MCGPKPIEQSNNGFSIEWSMNNFTNRTDQTSLALLSLRLYHTKHSILRYWALSRTWRCLVPKGPCLCSCSFTPVSFSPPSPPLLKLQMILHTCRLKWGGLKVRWGHSDCQHILMKLKVFTLWIRLGHFFNWKLLKWENWKKHVFIKLIDCMDSSGKWLQLCNCSKNNKCFKFQKANG